jgi:hypothetical protein
MKIKKLIIPLLLVAILVLFIQSIFDARRDEKVKSRFGELLSARQSGDSRTVFMLMTPSYRETHSIEDCTNIVWNLRPLTPEAVVHREGWNTVRLCERDPGSMFSPNSAMTWILQNVDGEWYFTGECVMCLD